MKKLILSVVCLVLISASPAFAGIASHLIDRSDVKGGLVVHIGCGDGKLTAELRADDSYIVQGLDLDPVKIRQARSRIQEMGLYGKITIDTFDGTNLPYIDNLVNLVVSEDLSGVPMDEVMRVLAPNGVACIKEEGRWKRTIKAWPNGMDDWTHYLHDPQGTSVGKDSIVGLPHRMQWVGGPKWLRNHDFASSLHGLVSSNGRIFYLIDEGLRNHIYMPQRWTLIARDAFNGTILWKHQMDDWFPHTWPFKSGPGDAPRKLVAVGDMVYVSLGFTEPLTCINATTGETIRTYEQTKATDEILLSDGILYLLVNPDKQPAVYEHESDNRGKERDRVNLDFGWSRENPPRTLMAVSATSGKTLWKHQDHIASLTCALDKQNIYFFDGDHIVSLDRKSGKRKWISEQAGAWSKPTTGYAPRLIVGDGVLVLSSQGPKGGRLAGLSAENGEILWKSDQLKSGHYSPEDLFLISGVVWTAATGGSQVKGTHFIGIDAKTGEVKQDFVSDQIEAFFMHQRCYPGKATERYIMTSGTGTEFLELGTEEVDLHHWLRGSCIYGMMPANGLIYRTPESCACYYQSKLAHFCALAAESKSPAGKTRSQRLQKGPAYKKIANSKLKIENSDSWPMYRHDAERSGRTKTGVGADITKSWQTKIGGKLSTMTAANGKLYVSAIDTHTVYALNADSGDKIWSYTTGGRVDSPPTIYNGLAVFGCADGWVYCLTAADGKLAWRYRAAPGDDKLVSYQQVESVWPLSGSILVKDGIAYCLAGRNMFVDGGMRLVRLDVLSGKPISETVLDDKDPKTGKNLQTLMAGKAVPVTNPDILSYDGKNIYMRSQKFDLSGKRVDIEVVKGKESNQSGPDRHLFCPTGFLDDNWFHRSYYMYGVNAGEGHGEYNGPISTTQTGRLMVFDESRIYSFFAHNVGNNINPRTYYSIYALDKDLSPPQAIAPKNAKSKKQTKTSPKRARTPFRQIWEYERPDFLANAMVLAGRNLFMAGPPDVADEEKTYEYVFGAESDLHKQLRRQEKVWQGSEGALLSVVSTKQGKQLAQYKLGAIPVWDGIIAAEGKLFLALQDGTVLCYNEK